MEVVNADILKNVVNNPSKFFENSIQQMPIYTIKDKLKKNELTIEDILSNDDCIEDLKVNPHSIYKSILTMENITKLIGYCIHPPNKSLIISYDILRFPYYSSELLCSCNILQFSKSIKSINANEAKKKLKEKDEIIEQEDEKDFFENKNSFDENDTNMQETIFQQAEEKNNDYQDTRDFYEDFMDFTKMQEKETESQINETEKANSIQYTKEERELIKNILDLIFNFLEIKFHWDETYIGYFQKLVNFLLIKEPEELYNYLFDDENKIKKFYNHIDNASIENTLENILNYLSDKENKEQNLNEFKFNKIIMELLKEIELKINKEYDITNDNDYIIYNEDKNKIEFICELIMNTLINNTEKNFIELVFNSNDVFMNKIKSLIEMSINLEYKYEINNKNNLIINLLKIVRQINTTIMNYKIILINKSYKDDISFFKDSYKKIKTFENQYFCKKYIDKENINKAFEKNRTPYINDIKYIYELIKKDLIKNTNFNNNNKENKNERGKTLMIINEWKYILSALKIFIFQFYAFDLQIPDNNNNDFYDNDLFDLLLKYYFTYEKNNRYQNILIDIIKLITFEKVPKYLIQYFIERQNFFIENIYEILNSKDKYNLLIGPNIQILLFFYTSSNPALIEFYEDPKNSKEKTNKEECINSIRPKFERKMNDEHEYTEDEIFSDVNDSTDTFDGNDNKNFSLMKFESFKTVLDHFLKKINFNKIINYKNILKMSEQNHNSTQEVKEENISQKMTITTTKKEEQKKENNNQQPGIKRKVEYSMSEKKNSASK